MKEQEWDFSDLLLDDSFVEQMNDPLRSKTFLQKLKRDFPERLNEIEMAVAVLQGVKNKKGGYPSRRKRRLWSRIVRNENRSYKLYPLRIAAGIMLVIGLGAAALYKLQNQNGIERAAGNFASDKLSPGLIFSDGRMVPMTGERSSVSYSSDGSNVEINDTAQVRQKIDSDDYNQLIAPFGKNISLVLSDGTKVWVHSGSRLVYPPVFGGKIREVYLYGEAYFEVTSNTQKPFIVRTEHFNTRVYGTRFAVQAYANENLYTTILLEGKVGLSNKKGILSREVLLEPGQKGSFTGESNAFEVKQVDHAENYISWVYGHLNFYKENVDQVLGRVARFYNIRVELPESIPRKVITGKLDLKNDPVRVLNGIAVMANLRLALEGNEYRFYKQ